MSQFACLKVRRSLTDLLNKKKPLPYFYSTGPRDFIHTHLLTELLIDNIFINSSNLNCYVQKSFLSFKVISMPLNKIAPNE